MPYRMSLTPEQRHKKLTFPPASHQISACARLTTLLLNATLALCKCPPPPIPVAGRSPVSGNPFTSTVDASGAAFADGAEVSVVEYVNGLNAGSPSMPAVNDGPPWLEAATA